LSSPSSESCMSFHFLFPFFFCVVPSFCDTSTASFSPAVLPYGEYTFLCLFLFSSCSLSYEFIDASVSLLIRNFVSDDSELTLDFWTASLCFFLSSIFERSAASFAFSSESLLSLSSSPKYLKAKVTRLERSPLWHTQKF
jgi:hypothetical protein